MAHVFRNPHITDEQIEQARSVDLLSYLQSTDPGSIRRINDNRHVLKEHDSFVMSNGRWIWNSAGIAGHGALDYLCKFKGMPFIDAVNELTDGPVPTMTTTRPMPAKVVPIKQPKQFILPKANTTNKRAIAYLMSRGISNDIIQKCIRAGSLYEGITNACVFVGKDGDTPKFAATRSTIGDKKKDVSGSDKQFSFSIQPENSDSANLAVFESPIDAMAHHGVIKATGTDWDGHRLSLSGTTSIALTSFLERHPEIDHIYLCLDNDQAGQDASNRIVKELLNDNRFTNKKVTVAPPPIGKDYGDTLQGIQQLQREISLKSNGRQSQVK